MPWPTVGEQPVRSHSSLTVIVLLQAVRNSGSAAQNMAHVASGVLDCYYEDGYGGPWDVAAGYVLATEAGGVVTHPEGDAFKLCLGKGKRLLAWSRCWLCQWALHIEKGLWCVCGMCWECEEADYVVGGASEVAGASHLTAVCGVAVTQERSCAGVRRRARWCRS